MWTWNQKFHFHKNYWSFLFWFGNLISKYPDRTVLLLVTPTICWLSSHRRPRRIQMDFLLVGETLKVEQDWTSRTQSNGIVGNVSWSIRNWTDSIYNGSGTSCEEGDWIEQIGWLEFHVGCGAVWKGIDEVRSSNGHWRINQQMIANL
jgi:hypothetical protein